MSREGLASLSGLAGGPFLWAASTQLGQILPYSECESGLKVLVPIVFAACLISLTFAGWSWSSAHFAHDARAREHRRSPVFLSRLGGMMSLTFALALLFQAFGSTLLDGCQR
ncbi:MAG: hypothetical protein JOY67_02775 [Hyphomicrobiales bacterium]|nr:hypothetical protein [Hyphomicrobiales bacterium]MBV9111725.1 hypothetical protein [Hyphomicrobiales bacterium]MBV9519651.1 hypothetical protein [Hyphomicrobiales bacterium]